MNNISRN